MNNWDLSKRWLFRYFSVPLMFFILFSCERDTFHIGQSGDFSFSTDTVMFDTIFTNLGTPTYKLLVHNNNNFNIQFDSVYLANKGITSFIVNINGETSLPIKKLTIDANDSLYIFVQAFIPATAENNPFIHENSILFVSGSNIKNVKLIAIGQNVIHFRNENIQSQEWFNTKPYLVFGTLTLDSGSILTIHKGVNIYFHRNSRLKINGTLKTSGTPQFPVFFRGDRFEKDYDTIPGQWGGIIITGTEQKHIINHAVIRNATTGIQIGEYTNDKVVIAEISNTFISNMAYSALIAYQADITAKNCVLVNTGNNVCSLYGGDYSFLHCTLANYGAKYVARSISSKTLVLQNFVEYLSTDGKPEYFYKDLKKAYFGNTILYGNSSDEVKLLSQNGHPYNYTFENCLLKISGGSANPSFVNSILNKSPLFIRPENENFRLDSLSPGKDAGKSDIGVTVPLDLENNSRIDDIAPDMGAYELKIKQ